MAKQKATAGSFKKGHEKVGGRQAGTRNWNATSIRRLLTNAISEEELVKSWRGFLKHRNQFLRFSALKLATFYLYGRPSKGPVNAEDMPQPQHGPEFDLSQIRTRHVPIQ